MQLSDTTLAVLKNFSTINNSILFKPGNKVQTISQHDEIIAETILEEILPREFAIYDLSTLLALFSLNNDKPTIEFEGHFLNIKWNKKTVRYVYTEPTLIKAAPYKEIKLPNVLCEAKIEDITQIVKAGNVLQSPNIVFKGDGENVIVSCENSNDKSSNHYQEVIGETDKTFNVKLKIETFKMMKYAYTVRITDKGIIEFKTDGNLRYWIAASK